MPRTPRVLQNYRNGPLTALAAVTTMPKWGKPKLEMMIGQVFWKGL